MPRRHFLPAHANGQIGSLTVFRLATVKLQSSYWTVRIPVCCEMVKKHQIAQGAQLPVFNLDNADIHKKCVMACARQENPDSIRILKQK